jgi:hypothetical protein
MKIRTTLLVSCLSFVAFACASSGGGAREGVHIGEEMNAPGTPVRLAVADASPKQYLEKTVLVEATVKAVCQHAGCWMQVEDEGHTAMVRWYTDCGGKYTFPKDIAGKRVLIQGSFHTKETNKDQAEHYEEEAGRKLSIPEQGYELNASSILILE